MHSLPLSGPLFNQSCTRQYSPVHNENGGLEFDPRRCAASDFLSFAKYSLIWAYDVLVTYVVKLRPIQNSSVCLSTFGPMYK